MCVSLARSLPLMSLFVLHLFVSQLRREKIDLENTLEQEQEALVNRLWKRMDKLEAEKRSVMMTFLTGSLSFGSGRQAPSLAWLFHGC